jgi:hypothetical protein
MYMACVPADSPARFMSLSSQPDTGGLRTLISFRMMDTGFPLAGADDSWFFGRGWGTAAADLCVGEAVHFLLS